MELLLTTLLSYLISLAANERSSAIHKGHEEKLRQALKNQESLQKALAGSKQLRLELGLVAIKIAKKRQVSGTNPHEKRLFDLLADESFQAELAYWLMAGGIAEGQVLKDRIAICRVPHDS